MAWWWKQRSRADQHVLSDNSIMQISLLHYKQSFQVVKLALAFTAPSSKLLMSNLRECQSHRDVIISKSIRSSVFFWPGNVHKNVFIELAYLSPPLCWLRAGLSSYTHTQSGQQSRETAAETLNQVKWEWHLTQVDDNLSKNADKIERHSAC